VGHLPKSDARSSRAWVCGKRLIALLTEKMQRHAASLSPGADAGWTKTRPRSHWRESQWLLELIRAAVWSAFHHGPLPGPLERHSEGSCRTQPATDAKDRRPAKFSAYGALPA